MATTALSSPFSFKTQTPYSPSRRRTVPRALPLPSVADLSAAASSISETNLDSTTVAVVGGGSLAALAAVLSLSDPEKRRQQQAVAVGGDDKAVVRDYFNNSGFQRWKKIYGDTDEVNRVQLDIRLGHSKTVENVMKMLLDEGPLRGVSVLDAGCGTGSLSIPLAMEGALVSASDISAAMVAEAEKQAAEALSGMEGVELPRFEVKDLESVEGKYDTVVCLDVLIHYPQEKADGMIGHLASMADKRLLLSFAPKTLYYGVLKRIGELFPGPSKATRAYLHAEADIERALQRVGWKIRKRGLITTQFYFARLVEAVPATAAS